MPVALIYLNFLVQNEQSVFNSLNSYDMAMLSLSGLVTVVPLLWFNAAATRMSLTALGFIQYLGPTVAFLVAVFVYDEALSTDKLITFMFIWIALLIFSFDGLKKRRA